MQMSRLYCQSSLTFSIGIFKTQELRDNFETSYSTWRPQIKELRGFPREYCSWGFCLVFLLLLLENLIHTRNVFWLHPSAFPLRLHLLPYPFQHVYLPISCGLLFQTKQIHLVLSVMCTGLGPKYPFQYPLESCLSGHKFLKSVFTVEVSFLLQ